VVLNEDGTQAVQETIVRRSRRSSARTFRPSIGDRPLGPRGSPLKAFGLRLLHPLRRTSNRHVASMQAVIPGRTLAL